MKTERGEGERDERRWVVEGWKGGRSGDLEGDVVQAREQAITRVVVVKREGGCVSGQASDEG